jgi:eukaryotic-like serine/threonine-protein kinase
MQIGTEFGAYEVVARLGAGGMGEVYRARDARLHRDVAIKVLPEALAQDAERRARFEREARTLASLNHPGIAMVHGLEETGGVYALVMELVEGSTLAEIIAQGRLPVPDALAIAAQIADALEAAHEQGIVHRDLKPANIKVRPDGTVKVLDFGLAKALEAPDRATDLASSPTIMATGRTEAGIILGTAAYMSPEQARGRPVDKRADIWAFGCVLYEMLTGRQAFSGESTTDILAEVVQREPDWSMLPADVPPSIVRLLRRALQKNARERLRDIGDARLELASAAAVEPLAHDQAVRPETRNLRAGVRRLAGPMILAAFAAGALAATAVLLSLPDRVTDVPPSIEATRSFVVLPPGVSIATGRGSSVALSPDGHQLVFVGRIEKSVRLYVRALDRFESVPLAGTEEASNPFFSPDGRWVGFFADGKLKKVSLDGGAPVTLSDARTPRGEAWLADNSILLTPANNVGVSRVPALGGPAVPFTTTATGELSHRWPRALPGGAAVLFSIWNDTGWESSRIAVQRAGEREHRVLLEGGGYPRAVYDPASHRYFVLYARTEGLLAAPFDADRLAITGAPVPIVDNVITNLSGGAHFDVAAGTLVYVPGTLGEADRDLVWVSLDGKATPARRVQHMSQNFVLSPDGTRILRNNTVGTRDVWIDDLSRGITTRVTNSADNFGAVWSPDTQWIVFARGVPIRNLYRRSLAAGAVDERLTTSPNWQEPAAISPDGSKVVYIERDPVTSMDIWVLDLPRTGPPGATAEGPPVSRPFLKTQFSENNPKLSPDGRWLAYQSNESGRFEVYARSFPDPGEAHQVSSEGGITPMWSQKGELFYRSLSGMVMSVPLAASAEFHSETPRALFDASNFEEFYGVAPDGKRFLIVRRSDLDQAPTALALVQNFVAELRQRVK